MRARWYRDVTGRFITRDPLEGTCCYPLSWNPYIYTWNNPVNRIDPSGRDLVEDTLLRSKLSQETKDVLIPVYYGIKYICYSVLIVTLTATPFTGPITGQSPLPWFVTVWCTALAAQSVDFGGPK